MAHLEPTLSDARFKAWCSVVSTCATDEYAIHVEISTEGSLLLVRRIRFARDLLCIPKVAILGKGYKKTANNKSSINKLC